MNEVSKTLIVLGLLLVGVGLLTALFAKVPGIGKLPGDIFVKKGNFSFYFPLATCLIVSLVLTFIFNFFGKR